MLKSWLSDHFLTSRQGDAAHAEIAGGQQVLALQIARLASGARPGPFRPEAVSRAADKLAKRHAWLCQRSPSGELADALASLDDDVAAIRSLAATPEELAKHPTRMRSATDRFVAETGEYIAAFSARTERLVHRALWVERVMAAATILLIGGGITLYFVPQLRFVRIQLSKLTAAQAALARSRARYRMVFDHVGAGILVTEASTGRVVEANAALAESLGVARDALAKRGLVACSPPVQADGAPSRRTWASVVERALRGEDVQFPWVAHSPGRRGVEFEAQTRRLEAGGEYLVTVLMDVTERNGALRRGEALRLLNEELRSFAYAASHDLKSPLRTLQGYATLLEETHRDSLDEDARSQLAAMRKQATRGAQLIDDLLGYAELDRKRIPGRDIDLHVLFGELREAMAADLASSGTCLRVDEALPRIFAPPAWAYQLMLNLVGNAVKFRRPGVQPHVWVRARDAADGVCVEVEDNGIGIETACAHQVFAPFGRLVSRDQYEGSGLGLATCQKIMRKLGGSLTFESRVGVGTTFRLTFPRPESRVRSADAAVGKPRDAEVRPCGRPEPALAV